MAVLDPDNPIPTQLNDSVSMIKLVSDGTFSCCALSGGPGIGKTYMTMRAAKALRVDYDVARGTSVGLLQTAYELRRGGLMIIDDCDQLVTGGGDMQANLMKQILAPEKVRTIVYRTEKSLKNLRKVEPDPTIPPPKFDIRCGAVWITNMPFSADNMPRDMEPHLRPLMDRGLHPICISQDPRHILNYVMSLVYDQHIELGLDSKLLSVEETNEVMRWFITNAWHLRSLSIRTLQTAAKMRKAEPNNWRRLMLAHLMKEPKAGLGKLPDIPTLTPRKKPDLQSGPASPASPASPAGPAGPAKKAAPKFTPATPAQMEELAAGISAVGGLRAPEARSASSTPIRKAGKRHVRGVLPEVPT